MKKIKKKPWDELSEDRCPKCGSGLMKDLFGEKKLGCACSFEIQEDTKELLVTRFNEPKL